MSRQGRIRLRSMVTAVFLLCLGWAGGCATSSPPVGPGFRIDGTYGAKVPAASGPGWAVHLKLFEDRRAVMRTDYLNDAPPVTDSGSWEPRTDGGVTVRLQGAPGVVEKKPTTMTFALKEGGLYALDYDRTVWGSAGLRLERQPEIAGRVWRLHTILDGPSRTLRPEEPDRYTLEMREEGGLSVRADCNRGTGLYLHAGSTFAVRRMEYTRELCSPDSLFDRYVRILEAAISCTLRDGYLYIAAAPGTTSLKFEPAGGIR